MKTNSLIKILTFSFLTFVTVEAFGDAQTLPDQTITSNVQAKIAANKEVSPIKIVVITNRGVVALNGTVITAHQASKLIELAESTTGVKDVDTSHLAVKNSTHPLDDAAITAKVKGTFIREKLLGNKDITPMTIIVETKDGVVYLSGTVANADQAKNAVALANTVANVKRVDSKLNVKS